MPTFSQKSSSLPSTTSSAVARVSCSASESAPSSSSPTPSSSCPSGSSEASSEPDSSSSSSGSAGSSASSSAIWAESSASISGVLTISSMASITLSQPRPIISASEFQRLRPALPVKWSMPPETVPKLGLPLKNFDTATNSQTDPMDEMTDRAAASEVTESSVGFSATSSSTITRSNCLSSAGWKVCACASVRPFHAG